jgi:DNA-binding IclR family transcriptional regulator
MLGTNVDQLSADVPSAAMSQLQKVLQALDVFTEQRPFATAEEVATLLGISRTTAFRQLAQLYESGLLTKISGRYSLGPRLIQLDYLIRRSDPLLLAAQEPMASLAAATRCSVVLSSLYGDQILNVHQEAGSDTTAFSYGRGRTLPLFRGAASKIILANLTPARLKAIYLLHTEDKDVQALGKNWAEFAENFRRYRRQGVYLSRGEVDPSVTGVAVALFNTDGLVIGSLALLFESQRAGLFNTDLLTRLVRDAAGGVTQALGTR